MYSLFALYLYNCTKSRIEIKFALSLYLFSPVNKVVLLRHLPALGSDNSIKSILWLLVLALLQPYVDSMLVEELDQSFNQN